MPPAPVNAAGLYHVAILYPERKDLAAIYKGLTEAGAVYRLCGGSRCV